jgi:hypothetical protein
VFAVGESVADPDSAKGVGPTEGVIVTEVAFVVAQVRITDCPDAILAWSTVTVIVGKGVCGGGVLVEFPPHAMKVTRRTKILTPERRREDREFTVVTP